MGSLEIEFEVSLVCPLDAENVMGVCNCVVQIAQSSQGSAISHSDRARLQRYQGSNFVSTRPQDTSTMQGMLVRMVQPFCKED